MCKDPAGTWEELSFVSTKRVTLPCVLTKMEHVSRAQRKTRTKMPIRGEVSRLWGRGDECETTIECVYRFNLLWKYSFCFKTYLSVFLYDALDLLVKLIKNFRKHHALIG